MAKKKQLAFLLQKDQKPIVDELTNEEAGIIFKAIYEYEETKKEPKLDKTLRIVFKQFKVKLDMYDEAYEDKCLKNKKNIEKYWSKIKDTTEYDGIQSNTMATNKRKENKIKENKNSECSDNKIYSKNTPPTTPTQVFEFCLSIFPDCIKSNLEESCNSFFYHYDSINWKDIENWQSKAQWWMRKDIKDGKIKVIDTSRRL